MKPTRFCLWLSILLVMGADATLRAEAAGPAPRKKYAEVKDPKERLNLCIEMLTDGTVQRGTPLAELQKVFGDQLREMTTREDGVTLYSVDFDGPPKPAPPGYATGWTGWYLRIEMGKHGRIEKYHLSNLHK